MKPSLCRLLLVAALSKWVSVDLARPALNLLQNDILTELTLSATGREPAKQTILNLDRLGSEALRSSNQAQR